MKDSLRTYLHDHLAGADMAIELLTVMKGKHKDGPLGDLVGSLLTEVVEDRDTLQKLADQIGSGSNAIKKFTAWLTAKASRAKLGGDAAGDLGTFEALEFLALGVLGKHKLWRALQVAAPSDARLGGLDYPRLITRAETQHARVEEQRLVNAATALDMRRMRKSHSAG